MHYLWQQPLQLDNRKLVSLLGSEPRTRLDQATRETLLGLHCLDNLTSDPGTPRQLA
jgi:hypothetical protein